MMSEISSSNPSFRIVEPSVKSIIGKGYGILIDKHGISTITTPSNSTEAQMRQLTQDYQISPLSRPRRNHVAADNTNNNSMTNSPNLGNTDEMYRRKRMAMRQVILSPQIANNPLNTVIPSISPSTDCSPPYPIESFITPAQGSFHYLSLSPGLGGAFTAVSPSLLLQSNNFTPSMFLAGETGNFTRYRSLPDIHEINDNDKAHHSSNNTTNHGENVKHQPNSNSKPTELCNNSGEVVNSASEQVEGNSSNTKSHVFTALSNLHNLTHSAASCVKEENSEYSVTNIPLNPLTLATPSAANNASNFPSPNPFNAAQLPSITSNPNQLNNLLLEAANIGNGNVNECSVKLAQSICNVSNLLTEINKPSNDYLRPALTTELITQYNLTNNLATNNEAINGSSAYSKLLLATLNTHFTNTVRNNMQLGLLNNLLINAPKDNSNRMATGTAVGNPNHSVTKAFVAVNIPPSTAATLIQSAAQPNPTREAVDEGRKLVGCSDQSSEGNSSGGEEERYDSIWILDPLTGKKTRVNGSSCHQCKTRRPPEELIYCAYSHPKKMRNKRKSVDCNDNSVDIRKCRKKYCDRCKPNIARLFQG
jgi:hypothetical protein